mmetsp:Transcript_13241/g.36577  ORF Transcript_13241/g.36577 Transcript_13241/m.36577 type:complete len:356 (-) Transcript_13241:244-1311(-)
MQTQTHTQTMNPPVTFPALLQETNNRRETGQPPLRIGPLTLMDDDEAVDRIDGLRVVASFNDLIVCMHSDDLANQASLDAAREWLLRLNWWHQLSIGTSTQRAEISLCQAWVLDIFMETYHYVYHLVMVEGVRDISAAACVWLATRTEELCFLSCSFQDNGASLCQTIRAHSSFNAPNNEQLGGRLPVLRELSFSATPIDGVELGQTLAITTTLQVIVIANLGPIADDVFWRMIVSGISQSQAILRVSLSASYQQLQNLRQDLVALASSTPWQDRQCNAHFASMQIPKKPAWWQPLPSHRSLSITTLSGSTVELQETTTPPQAPTQRLWKFKATISRIDGYNPRNIGSIVQDFLR